MKKIRVTNIFKQNYESKKTILINRGSARSSKSYSIAQLLLQRITTFKCKILIVRKTHASLFNTVYKDFLGLIKDYNYWQYFELNKSHKTLDYTPNGSYVLFTGLDDPERIKSSEFNYIWIEEATEFDYEDYMILKTRLSAPNTNGPNQLIMTFNPTDAFHWIKLKVLDKETDVEEVVSTYRDNPFLSKEYIKLLEATKDQDINYWRIYAEGQWGSLENKIYSNWKEIVSFGVPQQTIYGMDFGFNAPTAVIKVGFTEDGIYIKEKLYNSSMTNMDLINWIKKNLPPNTLIYADCAEPARIEEMKRHNINAIPADKSVKDGIDFVKRQKLFITSDSGNILKEIRGYSYKQKDGYSLDEPIKINDHAMDAIRYAIYTHLGKRPKYEIIS
jgi:phage terminase large subunit